MNCEKIFKTWLRVECTKKKYLILASCTNSHKAFSFPAFLRYSTMTTKNVTFHLV